jgi:hypothetical protein
MTKQSISRRSLLGGLGLGSVLFTPFVRSRVLSAAPQDAGNFLVFFTPNGFLRPQFGADNPGPNYTLRKSLAALEPYKSKLTVIRGLCNKSTSEKASHEDITRILTCREGGDLYRAYGPSIDHVIAQHLGGRPLTLAVERFRDDPNWQTKLSWVGDGANDPHVKDPKRAFDLAFPMGAVANPGSDNTLEQLHAQNRSVLDLVRQDIGSLKPRLSTADRAKLELHLEALREVELRVATATELPAPGPMCNSADVEGRSREGLHADQVTGLRQYGSIMTDIAATAFACGTRRVATIQWQPASGGINPNQGGGDHHQVSHYEAADSTNQWQRIDEWYANRFAETLKSLELRGVLDTTLVVWATEISEQHNQNRFVMLVAGGSALGIKTGQYIDLPFFGSESGLRPVARDSRNRSQADLWVSCMQAFGIASNTFGDAQYCAGPLAELYAS